jgi:hypothetical protein
MTSKGKATTVAKVMQLVEPLPFHSCALENDIPPNGVYLFFEKEGPDGLRRVTRIGAHRKDKGLARRLTDHYFADKNNSVFRKHLGAAPPRRNAQLRTGKLWPIRSGELRSRRSTSLRIERAKAF